MQNYTTYDNSEELELYEHFVIKVLERINFLYTDQLIYMLMKEYSPNVSYAKAMKVLAQSQRDGELLLSNDGFVMTKAQYRDLTNDIFYDKLIKGRTEKVDGSILNLSHLRDSLQTVDCMWIVADMLPSSDRFVIGDAPWLIEFIVPADDTHPARLYQVTKFARGEEMTDGLFIDTLEKYYDPEIQESLRRIVVLDDERALSVVPRGCGISMVVVLDDSYERGIRIVDKYDVVQSWNKNSKTTYVPQE